MNSPKASMVGKVRSDCYKYVSMNTSIQPKIQMINVTGVSKRQFALMAALRLYLPCFVNNI